MRKVKVFIAQSVDGYIADWDGGLDFLKIVEPLAIDEGEDGLTYGESAAEPEDYGYADFMRDVDTIIIGRKTYDVVCSFDIPFPHTGKECYVWSRTRTGSDGNVTYYGGDVAELVKELKSKEGGTIYIEGGGELIRELRNHNLIDEYIISVIPAFVGEGVPLFLPSSRVKVELELVSSRRFESGLVQLKYVLKT
jgi:dihydrofolate reductase